MLGFHHEDQLHTIAALEQCDCSAIGDFPYSMQACFAGKIDTFYDRNDVSEPGSLGHLKYIKRVI
jgi:hypothetical protein